MATEVQRLFVGGLTCTTSEGEIEDRLSRFGKLSDIALAKKDSVDGKQSHCFAHLNFHGDASQLKKLISTFHETRWKGNTIRIEKAKANFLDKLTKEREMKAKADPAAAKKVRGDQLMENFQKAGVENFTMKRVVPGTAVTGEKNWVVGKYGRVLPVVYLRTKDKRKVSKYDPSKYIHHLRQIREDSKCSTRDISSLTWRTGDEEGQVDRRNNSIVNGRRKLHESPLKRKLLSGGNTGVLAKNRKDAPSLPISGTDRQSPIVNVRDGAAQPGRGALSDRGAHSSGNTASTGMDRLFDKTEQEMESDGDSADTDEICTSKNKKTRLSTSDRMDAGSPRSDGGKMLKRELDGRTLSDDSADEASGTVVRGSQSEKTKNVAKPRQDQDTGYSFGFFGTSDAPRRDWQDSSSDMESDGSSGEEESTEGRSNDLEKRSPVIQRTSGDADPRMDSKSNAIRTVEGRGGTKESKPKGMRKQVSFDENVLLHVQGETTSRPLEAEAPDKESEVDVDDILNKEKAQYERLDPDDIIASIVAEMKVNKAQALLADGEISSTSKKIMRDENSEGDRNVLTKERSSMMQKGTGKEDTENVADETVTNKDSPNESGTSLKLTLISLSRKKSTGTDGYPSVSEVEELEDVARRSDSDDKDVRGGTIVARNGDNPNGMDFEGALKPNVSSRGQEQTSSSSESEGNEVEGDTRLDCCVGKGDQPAQNGEVMRRKEGMSGVVQNKYSGNTDFELLVLDRTILAKDDTHGVQGEPSDSFQEGGDGDASNSPGSEGSDDQSSSDSEGGGGKRVIPEFRGMTHFRNQLKGRGKCRPVREPDQSGHSGNRDFELLVLNKTMLARDDNCDGEDVATGSLPESDNNDGSSSSPTSEESNDSGSDSDKGGKISIREFEGMEHFRNRRVQNPDDSPKEGRWSKVGGSSSHSDAEAQSHNETTEKVHPPGKYGVQASKDDGIVRGLAGTDEKQKPVKGGSEDDCDENTPKRTRTREANDPKENREIFGFHKNKYSGYAAFDLLLLDGTSNVKHDGRGSVRGTLSKDTLSDEGVNVSSLASSEDPSGDSDLGQDKMVVQEFKGMGHLRNQLGDKSDPKTMQAAQDSSDSSDTEDEVDDTGVVNLVIGNQVIGTEVDSEKGADATLDRDRKMGVPGRGTSGEVPPGREGGRDADDETSSTESSDDKSSKPRRRKKNKRKLGDKIRKIDDGIPSEAALDTTADCPTLKNTIIVAESIVPSDNTPQESSKKMRKDKGMDGLLEAKSEQTGEPLEESINIIKIIAGGKMNGEVGGKERRKRDKPKRKKVKKGDSLKLANERRLQAVKERTKEMKEKQLAIKKALSSVDSVLTSEGKKHMRFDSSSGENASSGDGSDNETGHVKKVSENVIKSVDMNSSTSDEDNGSSLPKRRKETISLFKDDDEDGDSSSSDLDRFKSKPQFEGEKGAKLLKMQDAFGDDPRFNLDERFAEDDHSGDDNDDDEKQIDSSRVADIGNAQGSGNEGGGGDEDFESEKARSLSILENVLGVMLPPKKSAVDMKKTKFRDVNQIKFDPSREDHSKFVLAPVQGNTKKKKKSATKESSETPLPAVSRDTFADFQPDLKSAFSQEDPVTFSFFSGDTGEEPTSQRIDEVEEATPLPAVFDKEKLPWDSSDSEDERGEQVGNPERLQITQELEALVVPTQTRSFFFNSDDHRLKSGIGRFCRSEKGDIRDGWTETKTEMLIASTKRHQKALRDSQKMPRKRTRPSKRRRGGKKF